MWLRVRLKSALVMVATLSLVVAGGCSRQSSTTPPPDETPTSKEATDFAGDMQKRVTTDAMMVHLTTLQEIADANGGTRAMGTAGYEASVDYVANALKARGFDVQTPEFALRIFNAERPELVVGSATLEARPLEFTAGTGPAGVSGPLVAAPPDDTPGCTPGDYDGQPVAGAVVLVDRGSCPFTDKAAAAVDRGAVGMVVANNVDEQGMGGTLGENNPITIPVISVSKADGARLREQPGSATIKLTASTESVKTRNVIAQTKTGSTSDVVMAGAHLDSVPEGPGINDNGTGVAAVLETALQLGSSPPVQNAVRVGFWGAEELGLVGSEKYIESLDVDALKDLALYLNFDMVGSPNPGYFTYDGDQSAPSNRDEAPPRVPEGSAGIERTFVDFLRSVDKPSQDTSFNGRSDYDGFTQAGIPAGGLFTGAEEKKSAEQAELWGGTADAPFDPNYHKKTDTLDQIDRDALGINGAGVAYVIGLYAQDLGGRNGVPERDLRTRHVITKS